MSPTIKKKLAEIEARKSREKPPVASPNTIIPEDQKIHTGLDLHGKKPQTKSKKKPKKEPEPQKHEEKIFRFDFEMVKKRFSEFCNVKSDASGFTSLKDPSSKEVITYIINTKKGISVYERQAGKTGVTWHATKSLKTQTDLDTFIATVKRLIDIRASWKTALTPRYIASDGFTTESKREMLHHLQSQIR